MRKAELPGSGMVVTLPLIIWRWANESRSAKFSFEPLAIRTMPPSRGKLSSNRMLSWVPPAPESPPMPMPVGPAKTMKARPPAARGLYSLGKANPGLVVMSKSGTTPMHPSKLQGGALGSYRKKPIAVPPSSKSTFCKRQVRSVACTCAPPRRTAKQSTRSAGLCSFSSRETAPLRSKLSADDSAAAGSVTRSSA